MIVEEIVEKLRQLKHYSCEFDAYEARWKMLGGERAAYQAMYEAERNYVALFDWFYVQGIVVDWDRKKHEFVVRVPMHCFEQ